MDSITETDKAWYSEILVNSSKVKFKIDTGASVTAVPSSLGEKLNVEVVPTQKSLKAAGNQELRVRGKAVVSLQYGERVVQENVFLVDNLVTPLLGKPAITKFNDSLKAPPLALKLLVSLIELEIFSYLGGPSSPANFLR